MTDNALHLTNPSHEPHRDMTEFTTADYDHYHLNAPVPNLETDDRPSFRLDPIHDAFITHEEMEDDYSSEDEVSSRDDNDSTAPAVEVSYESDNEIEEEDDSIASETSDEEIFNESDYESECTIEDYPDDDDRAEEESIASVSSDRRYDHELFLPRDTSPSYELLKYESDEEEDDLPHHRSYIARGPQRPTKQTYERRPSPSNISDDSSEEDSIHSQDCQPPSWTGVTFDDTVTVHPVFETHVYSSVMIQNMYTKREELRINKLRNKREYAYDNNDWENATEECDMETDEDGELVHPVHTEKRKFTHGPFLSTSLTWQPQSGAVHRAKRMRMYYP
jgi:hypothetical protein